MEAKTGSARVANGEMRLHLLSRKGGVSSTSCLKKWPAPILLLLSRVGVLQRPLTPTTVLVVQSTILPEPPLDFPIEPAAGWPEVGHSVRCQDGVMISCMRTRRAVESERMAPGWLTRELESFCSNFVQRRRCYETRALRSIRDKRRGRQRFHHLMAALHGTASTNAQPGS